MDYMIKTETLGRDFPAQLSIKVILKPFQIALLNKYRSLKDLKLVSYPDAKRMVRVRFKQVLDTPSFLIILPEGNCAEATKKTIEKNLQVIKVFLQLAQLGRGAA